MWVCDSCVSGRLVNITFFLPLLFFLLSSRLAAATPASAHLLAGGDGGASGASLGLGLVAGLDLGSHRHEGLLDVGGRLGGRLQELDTEGVGELPGLVGGHGSSGFEVALVADQQLVHVLRSIPVDLVEPLLHVVERLEVGHVVDDDDAVGSSVVGGGDGSESLLTSLV